MKPLPTPDGPKDSARPIPSLPLSPTPGNYSTSNRKMTGYPIQRVYPWLLFASTAIAATFCLAYISKPVILANSGNGSSLSELPSLAKSTRPSEDTKILPGKLALPGDDAISPTNSGTPASPLASDFEETNIRIQHVLDAESPGGEINRIVIDVPVLYQSRNLRWNQQDAAEARNLLAQLDEYQADIRALRERGRGLRDQWSNLMARTIPADALRADSPSLPTNQIDPMSPSEPSDTIETIKLRKPKR